MTIERDVEYAHDDTRMRGLLLAASAEPRPTVLLLHDAFGLGGHSLAEARRYAALGFTVFAADVWGDRHTPAGQHEIGPLIGAMAGDRDEWMARLRAARDAATAQPEVDADRLVVIGYCFGGSSALELARLDGGVRGVIAVHLGLDLLDPAAPWQVADAAPHVLVTVGDADPMADAEMRAALQQALSTAGIPWEFDVYGGATHAFTNPASAGSPVPHIFDFHPVAAARSAAATTRFLHELLGSTDHTTKDQT